MSSKLYYHLSRKEANVLPVDVLAERHLQQRQSHVEGLDEVRFPGQRVIPERILFETFAHKPTKADNISPPRRLPPRHLALDLVEALQHVRLQLQEGPVEHGGADLVEAAGDEAVVTDLAERQVAQNLDEQLGRQLHEDDAARLLLPLLPLLLQQLLRPDRRG